MPNTPLDHCHQCKRDIRECDNPWTFHVREATSFGGSDLRDLVRFCSVNCIAAYYRLIPWPGRTPLPGVKVDAPGQ